MIFDYLRRSRDAIEEAILDAAFPQAIEAGAKIILEAIRNGGKIMLAGNGGSAQLAQHFAAELAGRFQRERAPLPALALGTDPTTLTALANDYGFEHVFERQWRALADEWDVLVAISTSGRSPNLLRAAEAATATGHPVIAMTGLPGEPLRNASSHEIVAPSFETPIVQQLHLLAAHAICGYVDQAGDW